MTLLILKKNMCIFVKCNVKNRILSKNFCFENIGCFTTCFNKNGKNAVDKNQPLFNVLLTANNDKPKHRRCSDKHLNFH